MRPNARVAGLLSRALSHEMSAVQQYLTQASLCISWGLGQEAADFRHEADEELKHVASIIRHMLSLGLTPNVTCLAPARPGRDMAEMLTLDREMELEAVRLYDEAQRHARRSRDEASSQLFASLLADERSHIEELDRLLSTLTKKEKSHG